MTTDDFSAVGAAGAATHGSGDGLRLPGEPLIAAHNIRKHFSTASGPALALNDASLEIRRREFFTLLGPSGCGKTTLLRVLAGFDRPDAGSLLLNGRSIIDEPPNKRPINMVFQSYALFPHMSVADNVAFGLEQLGMPRRAIEERVAAMLRLVHLEDQAARKPSQLSGGQQQRVALARALAPNPKLLLLDEPLSALDRKLRYGMQLELKRIQRETGVTFLLVTHDQDEALSMSDRIAVMDRGQVVQLGTPPSLYKQPRTSFVADFMGANVIPGALIDRPEKMLAIRPERVLLATDTTGYAARVAEVTYLGMTFSIVVILESGLRLNVIAKDASEIGAAVRCHFPADALWPMES